MKLDRTLLDKNGPPTEKEMREYFIKNDYTTAVSDFDVSRVSSEQNAKSRLIPKWYWAGRVFLNF